MARPEVTGRKISAKTERETDRTIPVSLPADAEQSRPEVPFRKIGFESAKRDANYIRGPPPIDAERDAFSVAEFCRRHGISIQAFYKYKDQMPAMFRVGTRVLISRESADAWRRARELAAPAEASERKALTGKKAAATA